MIRAVEFADRLAEVSRSKRTTAVVGVDPQLDDATGPGVPAGYALAGFCSEIVEACAQSVVAAKFQLAFFEARGIDGMRALAEVIAFARRLGLITIADAKRADIGSTSAAYAEAFLGTGDFGCDAITVNPYLGSDALAPFIERVSDGRGLFVLVKTSNPSSGELQDLEVSGKRLWEVVATRVHECGRESVGRSGLSSVGAVVGATYPKQAKRVRELMPDAIILVPGYGAQGADATQAVAAARPQGDGIVVSASRSLMYAYRASGNASPGAAAAEAAQRMRLALNAALAARTHS